MNVSTNAQAQAQQFIQMLNTQSHRLLDIVVDGGYSAMGDEDGWRRINQCGFSHEHGWVGSYGAWGIEVVWERDKVSCCLKRNREGQVRTYWYDGSNIVSKADAQLLVARRMQAEIDAETQQAESPESNLNALVRDGLFDDGRTAYEEWDALRRTMYQLHDGDCASDHMTVRHHERETHLICGTEGYTVANWCSATGTCSIMAPQKAAEKMAELFGNLIKNGLQYGWGRIES